MKYFINTFLVFTLLLTFLATVGPEFGTCAGWVAGPTTLGTTDLTTKSGPLYSLISRQQAAVAQRSERFSQTPTCKPGESGVCRLRPFRLDVLDSLPNSSTLTQGVESIKCYRCESTNALKNPFQCNEYFDDSELEPEPCDDVYGAKYCIKQIGRFEGRGLDCFQCDSAWDISCSDLLVSDGTLTPESCDTIHDARYCIKMTGGLGTKRFCSPNDLGNYCNYVRQPGDVMEYRSCYFTCAGDGCNVAPNVKPHGCLFILTYLVYLVRGAV